MDRCWGVTISPVVRSARWGSEMVRSNGFSGFDEWVWALLDERARSWVFWVKRSQFLGSSESVSGFVGVRFWVPISLLSLSLSLRVWVQKYFEVKIATEIILHQNKGIFRLKRKSFTVDRIFCVLPNTHFYGKAFPKMIWSQNKHSLNVLSFTCV